jgi:hypothetical protein
MSMLENGEWEWKFTNIPGISHLKGISQLNRISGIFHYIFFTHSLSASKLETAGHSGRALPKTYCVHCESWAIEPPQAQHVPI